MTEKMDLTLNIMTMKSTSNITIAGRPHANANMFTINIGQDKDNINLSFDVNFGKNIITLNTLKDGIPEHKKTLARFTFVRGEWFEVTFNCSKEEFTIKMPDVYTDTYTNYFHADKFSFIQVLGDVIIKSINI